MAHRPVSSCFVLVAARWQHAPLVLRFLAGLLPGRFGDNLLGLRRSVRGLGEFATVEEPLRELEQLHCRFEVAGDGAARGSRKSRRGQPDDP